MIKGIFIDAQTKSVSSIVLKKDSVYEALKKWVGSPFTVGTILENEDTVFVDDEGLINGTRYFFELEGAHQPFAGNALIFGSDTEGDSISVKSKLDAIRRRVTFLSALEVARRYE